MFLILKGDEVKENQFRKLFPKRMITEKRLDIIKFSNAQFLVDFSMLGDYKKNVFAPGIHSRELLNFRIFGFIVSNV
jgi:hypothetical protein